VFFFIYLNKFKAMKANPKELRSKFPYLTKAEIEYRLRTRTHKTDRGFFNYLTKLNAQNMEKARRPAVQRLEIEINWTKSRTWGYCPTASAMWRTSAGWGACRNMAHAGGCGYDKASTVIAEVCNKVLSGMLYSRRRARNYPYGVNLKNGFFPYFEGGVGVSCYYNIAKFLGGKLEHVASGKTYDKYVFTFKTRDNEAGIL
jgi:hypothetical protein